MTEEELSDLMEIQILINERQDATNHALLDMIQTLKTATATLCDWLTDVSKKQERLYRNMLN